MALSLRRLRTHASIALANAIAIVITIYCGWTLSEATLAYLGEFVILALVVYARVLAAKSLYGTEIGGWRLVGRKAIAIGITLQIYVFVVAFIILLVLGRTVPPGEDVFTNVRLPEKHAAQSRVVLGRLSRAPCPRVGAAPPRGRL